MMKIYTKTLLMTIFMIGSIPLFSAQYLVALSFDGNSYDADDLIAAPLALAILEESGNKNKLVHYDYGNNLYRETEFKNVYGDAAQEDKTTERKVLIDGGTVAVPGDITLEVSAINCNSVELNWTDTDGETAYRIRRKINGEATFTNITDVAANVTTYIDATASGSTNYIYMVRPLLNGTAVAVSNQPSVTTPQCEGGGNTGGSSSCASYGDINGLVIMETEFTNSNLGLWIEKTDVSGYTGTGHLEFTGNNQSSGPPTSPLTYTFTITDGGVYRLMIKGRKRLEGAESDKSNDCYVKLEGDFDESPNANDVHNGDALEADLRRNLKFFGGNANNWGWALQLDLGGENNKRNAVYTFKNGETYTLTIHGRSQNFNTDKIVFFKTADYTLTTAQNTAFNASETCAVSLSVKDDSINNKVNFFPNPVKDVINITEFEENDSVKIYDLTGKLIIKESAKHVIDASRLNPGVYLIKLGKNNTSKFIKQ